ncbi:MAG: efflux RND transporter periplasmic adaptor subunit [Sneathiella sp.]
MKIRNQIAILVLLGLMGALGWHNRELVPFWPKEEAATAKKQRGSRPVSVIGTAAIVRDLPRIVIAVGTLRANESVNLTSKITAKILRLAFEEGSTVKKGTPMVFLDSTEVKAEVAESLAELGNSRKLYERAVKLYKSGNAPKARVDLLLSEMQVAQAKVSADRARLSEYQINAPFSGVVGFREVSAGGLIRPGDMITTLDDVSELKLDFHLPESHLALVQAGLKFTAKSVAYKGRKFEGDVLSVGSRVDPVSRVVRVRGRLQNTDGKLKPGMFLSVSLQTGMELDAVLVPEHSVTVSPAGHFVYVVNDGKVKRVEIKTGRRVQGWVQAVSGIAAGQVVVTEGLQKIRDGRKVKLKQEDRLSEMLPSSVEAN